MGGNNLCFPFFFNIGNAPTFHRKQQYLSPFIVTLQSCHAANSYTCKLKNMYILLFWKPGIRLNYFEPDFE